MEMIVHVLNRLIAIALYPNLYRAHKYVKGLLNNTFDTMCCLDDKTVL